MHFNLRNVPLNVRRAAFPNPFRHRNAVGNRWSLCPWPGACMHSGATKNKKKSTRSLPCAEYNVITEPGQKKDVSIPLPASYSPRFTEAAWYSWWQAIGIFEPPEVTKNSTQPFVICLPPPNVTGDLHIGHALTAAIQDAIVRWNRMKGRSTVWVPGCDHAGIATQVVVEKKLMRERGATRHDLGRESFLEDIWHWKNKKAITIYEQLKQMGCSLSWSRARFTLDEVMSTAVTEAFVRLHDEGLLYRAQSMVNWCCHLRSTVSDIEVSTVPINGRTKIAVPGYGAPVEFGVLTTFKYPLQDPENKGDCIPVATTRVETMLGDTAIAVSPHDTRYSHLIGKFVIHPFDGRALPVVADSTVDPTFGTGAVKVTPAHSTSDYEIAKRHGLPLLNIFNDDGNICDLFPEYKGKQRFSIRNAIVSRLRELGLLCSETEHHMSLPLCSRSGDVIEPRLKEQWFLDCKDMAAAAIKSVEQGKLKLVPSYWAKTWRHFLEETGNKPWCVSRQLWWGHRIPAYKLQPKGGGDSLLWTSGRNVQEALQKGCQQLGVSPEDVVLEQDEDVLDTWFSAGLYPFAAFGWPNKTDDLQHYYPTSMIESGSDILFFWIARMVMLGQKLTGQLPFTEALLHCLLRSQGKKMSKSLGNVIDPMFVIKGASLEELNRSLASGNLDRQQLYDAVENQKAAFPNGIPECGADGLRFTLCSYSYKDAAVNMEVSDLVKTSHFCNKMWQTFKFYQLHVPTTGSSAFMPLTPYGRTGKENLMDSWILGRLHDMVTTCDSAFRSFDLDLAVSAIKHFWQEELCDVYLECAKPFLRTVEGDVTAESRCASTRAVLHVCIDVGLRCLSPFMPFLSEELYQRLPAPRLAAGEDAARGSVQPSSVAVAPYPSPAEFEDFKSDTIKMQVGHIMSIVHKVNYAKTLLGLGFRSKRCGTVYVYHDEAHRMGSTLGQGGSEAVAALARAEKIVVGQTPLGSALRLDVADDWEVYIQFPADIVTSDEATKMDSRLRRLLKEQVALIKRVTQEADSSTNDGVDTFEVQVAKLKKELAIIEKVMVYIHQCR